MEFIIENFNKINDLVIKKFGFEHEYTISVIKMSEDIIDSIKSYPILKSTFNDDYFKQYKSAILKNMKGVK